MNWFYWNVNCWCNYSHTDALDNEQEFEIGVFMKKKKIPLVVGIFWPKYTSDWKFIWFVRPICFGCQCDFIGKFNISIKLSTKSIDIHWLTSLFDLFHTDVWRIKFVCYFACLWIDNFNFFIIEIQCISIRCSLSKAIRKEKKNGKERKRVKLYAKWMTEYAFECCPGSRNKPITEIPFEWFQFDVLIHAIHRINFPSRWLGGWRRLFFFFLSHFAELIFMQNMQFIHVDNHFTNTLTNINVLYCSIVAIDTIKNGEN